MHYPTLAQYFLLQAETTNLHQQKSTFSCKRQHLVVFLIQQHHRASIPLPHLPQMNLVFFLKTADQGRLIK